MEQLACIYEILDLYLHDVDDAEDIKMKISEIEDIDMLLEIFNGYGNFFNDHRLKRVTKLNLARLRDSDAIHFMEFLNMYVDQRYENLVESMFSEEEIYVKRGRYLI